MSLLVSAAPMKATVRGRYLYAIVDGSSDGQAFDYLGLDGSTVYTIGDDAVAAIVSDLPNQKLRPERRRLAAHHAVLRELMAGHTVLPMAFGILADGPEAVRRILRINHDAFAEQLDRVRGRVEMGMRVAWDVANIFRIHDRASRRTPVPPRSSFSRWRMPTQDDKIDLGRAFDRLLNDTREAHLQRVTAALRSHTVEFQSNPPRSEREVLNLACLVDREQRHAFEQAVLVIASRFDNNFAFDINGPWPPHNFVDLSLELA